MDAYREGMGIHRVSVMVEVLAENADAALDYADRMMVTDRVVNDPRFVSFSISILGKTREVFQ